MYELAKVIHDERVRDAQRHRLASSLPRCRTWELGSYKITVSRRSRKLGLAGR